MNEERGPEPEHTGTDPIAAYIRLATTPPDEELLGRHFDACAGTLPPGAPPLTEPERRWVVTNLEANPAWLPSWRRREQQVGRAVAWQPHPPPPPRRAPDRRPGAGMRRAVAAAVVAGLLYAALWLGGRAALPETYQWASIEGYEALLTLHTRSTGTEAQTAFAEGARALLAARHSTLGLFPRYDTAYVERALMHLQAAFEATQDPFQRAEIAFFLAKASLMRGDVPGARSWLEQVEAQQVADYRTETARLLEALPRTP